MIVNIMASRNLEHDALNPLSQWFNVEVKTVDSDKNLVAIGYEGEVEYAQYDKLNKEHYVGRAREKWFEHDQTNRIWNASSIALNKIIERNPEILNGVIDQHTLSKLKGNYVENTVSDDEVLAVLHSETCSALHNQLTPFVTD